MTARGYSFGHVPEHFLDTDKLIERTLRAHLVDILGWGEEAFLLRSRMEIEREIPRRLFDHLEGECGWDLDGRRILDVGAGLGAAMLEAACRGASVWGAEPGLTFASVARARLAETGLSPSRVVPAIGEQLPFAAASFDYVISLQVLEHVADPKAVINEMYRVLRPGGECYLSCENYLSFREQHYRVKWLPLLPRPIGALYLRMRGRGPEFLLNHITYTTYPEIIRWLKRAGFLDLSFEEGMRKLKASHRIERRWARRVVSAASKLRLPIRVGVEIFFHLQRTFRVGVALRLLKPTN